MRARWASALLYKSQLGLVDVGSTIYNDVAERNKCRMLMRTEHRHINASIMQTPRVMSRCTRDVLT